MMHLMVRNEAIHRRKRQVVGNEAADPDPQTRIWEVLDSKGLECHAKSLNFEIIQTYLGALKIIR